jgi:polyribonucleotide nucleotidyltransferase
MFTIHSEEMNWGNRRLKLETGKVARQADGSVMVTFGDSQILCTVVGAKQAQDGADFFPLSVHYLEKTYAAGKIPGGFIKRETKPSDHEVLTSRLIDRPIRPLFPEGFYNEVQIICTVVSSDGESDLAIASIIGASAALSISGIPFLGPIAAARVSYVDGKYVLNSAIGENNSMLDLVVAGTKSGVLMVESEAKELDEDIMLGAVEFGHKEFQAVIDMILRLKEKASKEVWAVETKEEIKSTLKEIAKKFIGDDLNKAYSLKQKQLRVQALNLAREKCQKLALEENNQINVSLLAEAIEALEADILRNDILSKKTRIDGRGLKDIRPIVAEVGILTRTHGSALFTRGETQALVAITLGTSQDEQVAESLYGETKERFMLNYNFPPYSVGECGRIGAPGRREVGHGKLAWRALNPMLPTRADFSYSIRAVSEITESNGSSSMATVCGTSLALMDCGVPLKKPVSGIAMGLIKEGSNFAVLSDILGDEDHLGDMDFKVAGTKDGITALQMDIKITSITPDIMKVALQQAKEGRLHILGEMAKALDVTRSTLNEHAPKMKTIKISRDKIREVIGSGGKVIRDICEKSGSKVDIDEDGTVTIAASNDQNLKIAFDMINAIAAEPEIGKIYEGKVVKVLEFGAFVAFMGGREGMVHISELKNERVNKVTDVVNVGDQIKVKVIGIEGSKVKLSLKAAVEAA